MAPRAIFYITQNSRILSVFSLEFLNSQQIFQKLRTLLRYLWIRLSIGELFELALCIKYKKKRYPVHDKISMKISADLPDFQG